MFDDGHWLSVKDGDPRARAIFRRHYSAGKNGPLVAYATGSQAFFAGPGEKMILLTSDLSALWVWRLERFRHDNQLGINCAVFRNEGTILSSSLVKEADELAWQHWATEPRHFTYVADEKIRSVNPGYCFKKAGWKVCGRNSTGRLTILEIFRDDLQQQQVHNPDDKGPLPRV